MADFEPRETQAHEDVLAEREALEAPHLPWPGKVHRRRKIVNEHGQEKQHYLLSSAAVSISPLMLAQLTEDEAYEKFKALRFAGTGGKPVCIHKECGHDRIYEIKTRRIFKCGACRRQFSVTSGTAFASRKLPFVKILFATLIFINGASGVAALRLRRDTGISYKTSFVLCHKLRQSMMLTRDTRRLSGEVEIDGVAFPHSQRSARIKAQTVKIRAEQYQQVVVAARERGQGGESRLTIRLVSEASGLPFLRGVIKEGSTILADEGPWTMLGTVGPLLTVKHKTGYVVDGVATNQVESLFARLRRLQRGVHYRIIGQNLDLYAQEVSWREDYRRESNGAQFTRLLLAVLNSPVSARWKGYWQRWQDPEAVRRNRRRKITWRVEYGFNPVVENYDLGGTIEEVSHRPGQQLPPSRIS